MQIQRHLLWVSGRGDDDKLIIGMNVLVFGGKYSEVVIDAVKFTYEEVTTLDADWFIDHLPEFDGLFVFDEEG